MSLRRHEAHVLARMREVEALRADLGERGRHLRARAHATAPWLGLAAGALTGFAIERAVSAPRQTHRSDHFALLGSLPWGLLWRLADDWLIASPADPAPPPAAAAPTAPPAEPTST